MKVLSVLAQKGGTGKTTLAINWSVEAARRSRVVLIDTDPQRSAASWGSKSLAREGMPPVIPPENIDPINEGGLAEVLDVCREDDVDLVVIDTAPHSEKPAFAVASVSDLVVIPTRPSVLDLEAIEETVKIAQALDMPAVIVLNACPPRSPVTEEARQALKAYGLPICPTPVVQRIALAYALVDGRGVQQLEPKGKAAAEIAATWKWLKRRL